MARWQYCSTIPEQVDIPNKTLNEIFQESAKRAGDKPFLAFQGKIKTYDQAAKEVRKLANALMDLGIKKGDRVALLMPNCPQYIVSYLSIISFGGTVTAISPLYTAKEIAHQLSDSGAVAVLTLDLFLDKIRTARKNTNVQNVIVSSIGDELSAFKSVVYRKVINRKAPKPGKDEIKYKKFLASGRDEEIKVELDAKEDLVCLQYTGGTTGSPKGAMLTHYNLVSQVAVIDYWEEWLGGKIPGVQNRHIAALPLSHIFGLTTSFFWPIYQEGMIALIPDPRNFKDVFKTIEKYQIHFFNAVPTLYQKLANDPEIDKYDLSSLRLCISGGASLHPDIMKKFEEKSGALLIEGFGLSEASPVTHINPADKAARKDGIGIPIPNTDSKIINIQTGEILDEFDEDGLTAEGELIVKGPQIMKGYWNKPEESAKVLLPDGWLKTGDVAKMDKDGFFVIVDRLKDVIFASGFQVWPLEVEEALCKHPDISMAAVIPVKKEDSDDELVKAVIVASEGAPRRTQEEIRTFCKENLAPYKVPKLIEYRDELPLSPVGKILRRPLREEARKIAVKKKN